MRDDDREARHQLNGLAHHVLHAQIVRVGVAGIQREDRTAELVHNVVAGIFEDHILGKVLRKCSVRVQDRTEPLVLLTRGQLAQQEQICNLRKAEAPFADVGIDEVGQIIAAVDQAALHGHAVAVHDGIAENVADLGAADHDARAVVVAQAALDVAVRPCFVDQRVMDLVIGA